MFHAATPAASPSSSPLIGCRRPGSTAEVLGDVSVGWATACIQSGGFNGKTVENLSISGSHRAPENVCKFNLGCLKERPLILRLYLQTFTTGLNPNTFLISQPSSTQEWGAQSMLAALA